MTRIERAWQRRALDEAALQPEDGRGELIEYWLQPQRNTDFNGKELVNEESNEPSGPFTVSDPRCCHGTLTDEQVFEYVLMTHGEPPLMFMREAWGDEKEEG